VVHSGDSGGTWNGAKENLNKRWVPLWVKRTEDKIAGNSALVHAGGRWLEDELDTEKLEALFLVGSSVQTEDTLSGISEPESPEMIEPRFYEEANKTSQIDSFSELPGDVSEDTQPDEVPVKVEAGCDDMLVEVGEATKSVEESIDASQETRVSDWSFYDLFVEKIKEVTSTEPKTSAELAEALELKPGQVNEWLKRAEEEGKVIKLAKPVRYQTEGAVSQKRLGL
jgi:predicted Rossmann fold nucleotide-binding protein DprA/Smf involved in DNA uptake